MNHFNDLIRQGATHAWFFIPTAILLGALHGLEPGHSKTMMAAFIIAVRGTILQAVLLGLAAAFSHTLLIWILAALALHYGSQWNPESTEPYFQMGSAVMVIGLAAWMAWRTRRDIEAEAAHGKAGKSPHGGALVKTDCGAVGISVFEEGVPPVFRLFFSEHGQPAAKPPSADSVTIETIRLDGAKQVFRFADKGGFLESTDPIPEPHDFDVVLTLAHGNHAHQYHALFAEPGHDHADTGEHGHHSHDGGYRDDHEKSHAVELQKRFSGRTATTWQIIGFGLTGGLLPCPAAFTILLICLQVKKFVLGMGMVLAFSFGLAVTLVAVGVLAAWSLRHAERKFNGVGRLARRLPYFSSALLTLMGLVIGIQGWLHLHSSR